MVQLHISFAHAIQISPLQALYGCSPLTLLDTTLQQHKQILIKLKENLKCAHQRMNKQANKHRSNHTFTIGDRVWLKLQACHQHTVAHHTS